MLFPGITCYCVIAVFFFFKGEGSSPHAVQGICSQIQSSQISKSALPPVVQDWNAARETVHDTDGMSGTERYVCFFCACTALDIYSCIFIQSVRNSFYGVLLDRLHKLKQILKVPSDWSVTFSVYFKSFRILRKLNSYKNKVCR